MRTRFAAILVLLAVLSPLFGDGPLPRGKNAPPPTDAELERIIRARFARSKIGANGFEVRVRAGVATLDGRCEIVQHKGTATRLARLAGAARVVNRIKISDAAREKAAGNLTAGRRRAQVKRGQDRSEVAGRQ